MKEASEMSDSMTGKQLALARRQALSQGGKSALQPQAVKSNDVQASSESVPATLSAKERRRLMSQTGKAALPMTDRTRASTMANQNCDCEASAQQPALRTSTRSGQPSVVENSPGRATAKARREALSSHGKRALTGNQDGFGGSVSGRAAARALREEKSRFGAKNLKQSSSPRPVRGARDASWKVASTMTEGGNEVSGTSVQHDPVMTGSDQGVCQAITGTDYLSGEAFENACLQPESSRRQATRLSDTLGGNTISGNELGAGEQLTGNRTGMCQTVTGTEYMAAGQFSVCHAGIRRHDGPSTSDQTTDGLPVSGGERNHARVTGTESSSMVSMTGSQYLSQGLAATQASRHHGETLRNPDRLTGALLSTNRHVTGDTRSVGNQVTGDNYVANDLTSRSTQSGTRQRFGGNRLATDRISGSIPQRSQAVTGDEPGTCQHLTGTPYVGRDTQVEFCDEVGAMETARRMAGSAISGIQPGVANGVTGDARGADHPISGTPYHGEDQLHEAFGMPQARSETRNFSIGTPARQAMLEQRDNARRITGSFGRAEGKITGSDEANFQPVARANVTAVAPDSVIGADRQITGEGRSLGLTITGDDWDRNSAVTGTEGRSAISRNQTRRGDGQMRVRETQSKPERESSRVTGSSGNTSDGALITYSGGARG